MFVTEVILATRVVKEKQLIDGIVTAKEVREYHIKWVGFRDKDNTWEPEQNLQCYDRINAFWRHICDNNVQDTGRLKKRKASEAWIETQKILAAKEEDLRRAWLESEQTCRTMSVQSSKRRKSANNETERSYMEYEASGINPPVAINTAGTDFHQPQTNTIFQLPNTNDVRVPRKDNSKHIKKPITLRIRKRVSKAAIERTPSPVPAVHESEALFFRTPSPVPAPPVAGPLFLRTPSPVPAPPEPEPLFSREPSSLPTFQQVTPLPRPPRPYKVVPPPRVQPAPIETTAAFSNLGVKTRIAKEVAPNISVFMPHEMQSAPDAMPELVPNTSQGVDGPEASNRNTDVSWGDHLPRDEQDDVQEEAGSLFKSPTPVARATTPSFDDLEMSSLNMDLDLEDNFATMDPFSDHPMQDYLPSEDPVAAREKSPLAADVQDTAPDLGKDASALGGIITFTVDSLIECPIDSIKLMRRVQVHPCWEFYVRPATLIAAAHTLDKLIIDDIARLIVDGAMSLLRAQTSAPEEPLRIARFKWFYGSERFSSTKTTLEACRSKMSPSSDIDVVDGDTARRLLAMRLEPEFCHDYARFVLVAGKSGVDFEAPGQIEVTTTHRLLNEFDNYPDATGFASSNLLLDSDSDEY
ncbi:hypothetical protein HWV62_4832 [Athelia sp. TMB]|nr:hypothetical protein HWV62_4832 [Athelia sp. TMB]